MNILQNRFTKTNDQMNVYQCDHCGNIAEAESQQISGEPRCVMATHSWKILGKVGPNKWNCERCGVTVKTMEIPSRGNGKCSKDGNSTEHHKWKQVGVIQSTRREEKKEFKSENQNSTSKKSSSFLDKLGVVGTVIKIVWFPFKVVLKIGNWFAKLLGGSLFD